MAVFEEALEIAKEDKGFSARHGAFGRMICSALVADLQGAGRGAMGQALPAGRARSALGRGRRGVRFVAVRARQGIPPAERHPRQIGAPRSTCRRWCSAIWAKPRPPASPSRAIPPPASALIMASFSSTRRARMSSRASARRNISRSHRARAKQGPRPPRWKRPCPKSIPSSRACSIILETHYRDMQDIEFTVQQRQALDAADARGQAHRKGRAQDRGGDGGARGSSRARKRSLRVDAAGARSACCIPTLDPDAHRDDADRQGPARLAPARPPAHGRCSMPHTWPRSAPPRVMR